MNGESTSMVWPTLGSRKAKEQNRTTVYPMHWIDPVISFFRLSVCLCTDRLMIDYVHNSLPIFTKFCMRLRNVVASSPTVCKTNRK